MTFYQFSVEILFPVVILIVAFGMGLTLTPGAFLDVVKAPKRVLVGVFGQLVFLPLIAFAFVSVINLAPVIAMGLILIAACPGGTSSNAIIFAVKGEVALSVMLTAFSSVLILVTLPFWIQFGLERYGLEDRVVSISFQQVIKQLFLYMILPLMIGMGVRRVAPTLAGRAETVFRTITIALFVLIIGVSIHNVGGETLSEMAVPVTLAALALSLILQLSAYFLPKLLQLSRRDRVTYAVEVGVQNTVLAIFVGATLLQWPELAIVAIIYGLVNYALIAGLLLVLKASPAKSQA